MESNQNTKKATKAKTRYCKECKASYSLQLFNIRGCNMDECRFCYYKQESAAIIEKQSRTIQELSRQLELNRQLELSRHLELNRQIDLLAGRLATIEKNQKQHYEHELRLQRNFLLGLLPHFPLSSPLSFPSLPLFPSHFPLFPSLFSPLSFPIFPSFLPHFPLFPSQLSPSFLPHFSLSPSLLFPSFTLSPSPLFPYFLPHFSLPCFSLSPLSLPPLFFPLSPSLFSPGRRGRTSLALQETLAKPQNYWQPDHDHWDTLNKTALSQHDNRLGQLKMLVGNVQSLLPKMSELQAIASKLSHDIIAINETWLDLNGRHLPAEVSIKGYVLHNVDKPSHSNRGGGSLIYVKEKLQPQIKTKRATTTEPHPGQTIKIVLVYRNPTCTAIEDDEFYDCLDIILSTPHETLIMGDFNLPHINWTTRQSQAPGSKLIDLMNTNSLQQHVNEPT
ncbi:Endonuclease/exonuclease/phosphatase, partial [Trinorchestia longiramus]